MRSTRFTALLPALCALWLVAACEPRSTAPKLPAEPATGSWQGLITLPGGDIETAFELQRSSEQWAATLVNGQERFPIDEVSFTDGELVMRFAVFNNEIRARLVDQELQGELILVKRYGETQRLPFRARPGSEHAHPAQASPATIDMSGRWSVWFNDEDGSSSPSIGEFAQRGSRLFGTFVNTDGDHRYLSGHVTDNRFVLSTFDGAHAYLFSGNVEDQKIANAGFWSGNTWYQTWSGVRDENVELPDAYDRTHMRGDTETLTFTFPDQNGTPVSFDDEMFAGKVVIITLSGTWCPNCNDEARFLSTLYDQYADDGLEIITLMFEHFDDPQIAVAQINKYRAKHTIRYTTLLAGISDKVQAAQQLPALDAVWAFPTTIFVDRDGRVRTIHTGFSGPGTGGYHERLKQEFQSLVVELIAEPETRVDSESEDPVVAE